MKSLLAKFVNDTKTKYRREQVIKKEQSSFFSQEAKTKPCMALWQSLTLMEEGLTEWRMLVSSGSEEGLKLTVQRVITTFAFALR